MGHSRLNYVNVSERVNFYQPIQVPPKHSQSEDNRYIITCMLHQIFMYSDKVMLAAG